MSGALGKLMALAEAYPDLKASENFRDLQTSLATIEDEIQMARRYYNGAARNLNVLVEILPEQSGRQRVFGFRKRDYFEIDDADRQCPGSPLAARRARAMSVFAARSRAARSSSRCRRRAGPALAAEEILGFDSAVIVRADGVLDVTETIRVRAEGDQIKHGIYRDFPLTFVDDDGRSHRV